MGRSPEDPQADQANSDSAPPASGKKTHTICECKLLPGHLPRDEQISAPVEGACPPCGAELRYLGDDIS